MLLNKFSHFLGNTYNTDSSNVEIIKLMQKFEILAQKHTQASSYIAPQLARLSDKYLKELLADKRIKGYENSIKEIIRNKPHTLDEKSCALLAKICNSFNNSSSVFDIITDSEMTFKDALDSKNKPHKLDQASYSVMLSGKDRVLRKNAFKNFLGGYGQFNKTFAELFVSNLKADNDNMKLHNFDNLLQQQLFDEQVPEIVFKNNIAAVNKHLNLNQNMYVNWAKISDLKIFPIMTYFWTKKSTAKLPLKRLTK